MSVKAASVSSKSVGSYKTHFEVLDGIRGVAALAVMQLHFAVPLGLAKATLAWLAVDLFFALSGFVIAYSYGERLRNGMTSARFMTLRLVRLMPLHCIGIGLAIAAGLVPAHAYLSSLLFIPLPADVKSSSEHWVFPANFPIWSLFFELFANLAFAYFVRWLTLLRLAIAIAVLAASLLAMRLQLGTFNLGADWTTFFGGFSRVSFSFLVGVGLFEIRRRMTNWNFPLPPVALLAFAAALLWGIEQPGYVAACIFAVFPTLLLTASLIEATGWQRRLCQFLGSISYALYVIHVPLRDLAMSRLGAIGAGPVAAALWFSTVLLLAWALDRYFDRPVRRKLTQLIN